ELGCNEGRGREPVRPEGAAGIEPEPPYPQKGRTDDAEGQNMRSHWQLTVSGSPSKQQCRREGRSTGAYVNDSAAREVQCAHCAYPSTAPNPVGQRIVDQC